MELDPANVGAILNRGAAYLGLYREREAEADFQTALSRGVNPRQVEGLKEAVKRMRPAK